MFCISGSHVQKKRYVFSFVHKRQKSTLKVGIDHEPLKGSSFFLNQTDLNVPQNVNVFRFKSKFATVSLDWISELIVTSLILDAACTQYQESVQSL